MNEKMYRKLSDGDVYCIKKKSPSFSRKLDNSFWEFRRGVKIYRFFFGINESKCKRCEVVVHRVNLKEFRK